MCLGAALLSACNPVTPQQTAAQDARDVAQVEAVQKIHPPAQPLRLEPISPNVRKVFRLADAGCEFHTDGRTGGNPVLVASRAKAVLLIGGEPAIFAADSGSPTLASGVHEKYVGRTHWAQLAQAPASLTLRDRFGRIVYQAAGTLTCHG